MNHYDEADVVLSACDYEDSDNATKGAFLRNNKSWMAVLTFQEAEDGSIRIKRTSTCSRFRGNNPPIERSLLRWFLNRYPSSTVFRMPYSSKALLGVHSAAREDDCQIHGESCVTLTLAELEDNPSAKSEAYLDLKTVDVVSHATPDVVESSLVKCTTPERPQLEINVSSLHIVEFINYQCASEDNAYTPMAFLNAATHGDHFHPIMALALGSTLIAAICYALDEHLSHILGFGTNEAFRGYEPAFGASLMKHFLALHKNMTFRLQDARKRESFARYTSDFYARLGGIQMTNGKTYYTINSAGFEKAQKRTRKFYLDLAAVEHLGETDEEEEEEEEEQEEEEAEFLDADEKLEALRKMATDGCVVLRVTRTFRKMRF